MTKTPTPGAEYHYTCGHTANQPGATQDRDLPIRCAVCRVNNPTDTERAVMQMSGLADQLSSERMP